MVQLDDMSKSAFSSKVHSLHDAVDDEDDCSEKDTVVVHETGAHGEVPSNKTEGVFQVLQEETTAHEGEDEIEYPQAWKLVMISIALCLAVLCIALDNTILASAIPRITNQFNSLGDVGWYGSSYLLCTCAFQLLFGKLYTFYPIKIVFLTAIAIFELGSLVCGVAPNSTALIIGRAIAGLGSAGLFSGAILIITHTVPLAKRPVYTGMIGAMYGIASVVGPLLGGVFTDHVTWRLCFLINLPLGLVTIVFIAFFFKSPGKQNTLKTPWREQVKKLDLEGSAVFLPGVVCLLLALQWGGSVYPWNNWRPILCLVLFAVLIAAFIAIQIRKQERATVPPRVLKQRTVAAASWYSACLGAAFFIMLYYLPIWFQAIKHVSATKSGLMSLPLVLGLVVISIVAGIGVTVIGYYTPFCIASSILMSIGAGLCSTWTVTTGHPKWIGYQLLLGVGIGLGMQQPLIAVQAVLPAADVPIGTAIIMFTQTLGGALFVSVGQNVFENRLLKGLQKSVPDLNPALVVSGGATSLVTSVPAADLAKVLVAYNDTLTQVFYVAVAMAALSLIGSLAMEWKSVKGQKLEMAAA